MKITDIINKYLNPKKDEVPVTGKNNYFNYKYAIKNETQLFRVRTSGNNLRTALLQAENPQLRNRWELLRVYQNVDLDPTVKGLIKQRVLAVLSGDMMFTDINGDVVDVDIQNDEWFRKFIELSHESLFWGFSFIQIGDIIDNKISRVELIPRVYCRPDFDLISTTQQGNADSFSVYDENIREWVLPIYRDNHDLGDYSFLSTFIMMKQFNEVNWAEFCEKYGTPFVIGKTDLMNIETRDNYANMLANFGSTGWAIMNKEDDLDTMQISTSGESYNHFLKYINEQLSISILGQTLTSQSQSGGTEQLGKIHNKVLDEIIQSDIYFIETQVKNKLIPLLKFHKLIPNNVVGFKIKRKEEIDVKNLIEQVKMLSEIGIEVDKEWLSQKINLPFKNGN